MNRGIGTMFIDEQPVPIDRIYLSDGKFCIETVALTEERVLPAGCEIRIHDPDGRQVGVFPGHHDKDIEVPVGSSISMPLRIEEVDGWPR